MTSGNRLDEGDTTSRVQSSGSPSRRRWLAQTGLACAGVLAASRTAAAQAAEEVTPAEDLMREHGVLKRVLLVYEEAIRRIEAAQELPPSAVRDGADIIRTFIEAYHEKLEEDHLFPRFERANRLADLTAVFRAQHAAGRRLTERIVALAAPQAQKDSSAAARLKDPLRQFIRMYGPHAAREDTVLFPAIRDVVPAKELAALGDRFEDMERTLLGEEGFEKMVERVASIEKALGIYDLAQFTPR